MHHSNAGNTRAQHPKLLEEVKNAVVVEKEFLDEFFVNKVSFCKHDTIYHVIKILPTINHGQAYVERGFS